MQTFLVATHAFLRLAQHQAAALGAPDLETIEIPHPLASLPDEQAVERGFLVAERLLACLGAEVAAGA